MIKGLVVAAIVLLISPLQAGDLAGYWRFNEGSGAVAVDSSGNGNDGTIGGALRVPGLALLGTALQFDGLDDYVLIPDAPSLNISGQEITITFWAKMDYASHGWLAGKGSSDADVAWFVRNPPQDFTMSYLIRAGGEQGTEQAVTLGGQSFTWQHYGVAYDGSKIRFFVNGVAIDSMLKSGAMDVNSEPMYIGLDARIPNEYWSGIIDEVRLYNRALTQPEMHAEYRSGFIVGDPNSDGKINVGDVVYMINYAFKGPAPKPLKAGDANCDGKGNVGDAVFLINYVFKQGPAPNCP
jgi:hypothetical protein